MGWLFAVALGMQEGSGRAVWRALGPLALGHVVAVTAVVFAAAAIGIAIPERPLQWIVAAMLVTLGASKLFRHSHIRYGGMRVRPRQLATWSFLMATAHGAGLMVLPFVLGSSARHAHAGHDPLLAGPSATHMAGLAVGAVHTLGYLVVTGTLAWLVFSRLGLRMLRSAWINLDLVWAVALIATGLATPLL
jgi:hypothetical protein